MLLEGAPYHDKMAFFREKVTIYPVSCEPLANGRSDIEWLESVLAGGARIVQLRDKYSNDLTLYQKALVFREKTNKAGALFIVNNRVDIAMLVKADGVHLGQKDESPLLARRILGENAVVGISISNLDELKRTDLTGCDYIGTGPVYTTRTKKDAKNAIGPAGLETVE